jgi:hypothetical protein
VLDPSSSSQNLQLVTMPSKEDDNSKMKEVVQQMDQNVKGVQSTSSKGSKAQVENIVSEGKTRKKLLYENRVQVLSGNNMADSEDDLLSEELQEGSADQKKAFGRLNIGLVRYSELVVH